MDSPHELLLYPKRSKLWLGGLGAGGTLAVIIALLLQGPSAEAGFFMLREPLIFYTMGAAMMLVFGYFFWFAARNLLMPVPWAVLTPQGVAVDGLGYRFGAHWSAFSGLGVLRKRRGDTWVLMLKNAQAFADAQPSQRLAATARALTGKYGSPFMLDMTALAANPQQVAQFLDQYLPAASRADAQATPAAATGV